MISDEKLTELAESLDHADPVETVSILTTATLRDLVHSLRILRAMLRQPTTLAGATTPPALGVESSNPGEFAALWNRLDEEGRAELFAAIMADARTARDLPFRLDDLERTIASLRAGGSVAPPFTDTEARS